MQNVSKGSQFGAFFASGEMRSRRIYCAPPGRGGGTGRRAGFKIRFPKGSASSILAPGTNKKRFSEFLEFRDTDLQHDDVQFSVNYSVAW